MNTTTGIAPGHPGQAGGGRWSATAQPPPGSSTARPIVPRPMLNSGFKFGAQASASPAPSEYVPGSPHLSRSEFNFNQARDGGGEHPAPAASAAGPAFMRGTAASAARVGEATGQQQQSSTARGRVAAPREPVDSDGRYVP